MPYLLNISPVPSFWMSLCSSRVHPYLSTRVHAIIYEKQENSGKVVFCANESGIIICWCGSGRYNHADFLNHIFCCSLTFCSLSENKITVEGSCELAGALEVNRSLQDLKWVHFLGGVHWDCTVHHYPAFVEISYAMSSGKLAWRS